MVTIQPEKKELTLINVFAVSPEKQQQLLDLLVEASQTMKQLPGFISANLHKSHDGKYVVNYAQWRSQRDYDAMQHNPQATSHMKAAAGLAQSYNPIICDVTESVSA